MFCRYRRTTSHATGPASCCAGEDQPLNKTEAGQRPARAMPADRLRPATPQQQQQWQQRR
jgi:hypothetical protein